MLHSKIVGFKILGCVTTGIKIFASIFLLISEEEGVIFKIGLFFINIQEFLVVYIILHDILKHINTTKGGNQFVPKNLIGCYVVYLIF